MRPLSVATSEKYPIYFVNQDWQGLARQLKKRFSATCIGIVTSPAVARHYLAPLCRALRTQGLRYRVFRIPDGESHKTLITISALYSALIRAKMGRRDPLIALGGGVIGDMVGFAAATYLRGVPYVQVPTTLLAQVDSSVGGKTGIDHLQGKNLIGAFYQPTFVWIDSATLQTLPEREIRAGFAEVIKYGAIADNQLFNTLYTTAGKQIQPIIRRCVEIKAKIVAADEKETTGLRSLLNFGHTVGHAIEAAAGYKVYLHGEAVAIGMVIAARISHLLGLCPQRDVDTLERCLKKFGLETTLKKRLSPATLAAYMQQDKKMQGKALAFVALRKLGQAKLYPLPLTRFTALLKKAL